MRSGLIDTATKSRPTRAALAAMLPTKKLANAWGTMVSIPPWHQIQNNSSTCGTHARTRHPWRGSPCDSGERSGAQAQVLQPWVSAALKQR
jgi:hypothetical protein